MLETSGIYRTYQFYLYRVICSREFLKKKTLLEPSETAVTVTTYDYTSIFIHNLHFLSEIVGIWLFNFLTLH